MKFVILIVVVILAAPTIAKRLSGEEETETRPQGGLLVRLVRRHGLRRVGLAVLLLLALIVAAVVIVITR